jgi:hypothetical protein
MLSADWPRVPGSMSGATSSSILGLKVARFLTR